MAKPRSKDVPLPLLRRDIWKPILAAGLGAGAAVVAADPIYNLIRSFVPDMRLYPPPTGDPLASSEMVADSELAQRIVQGIKSGEDVVSQPYFIRSIVKNTMVMQNSDVGQNHLLIPPTTAPDCPLACVYQTNDGKFELQISPEFFEINQGNPLWNALSSIRALSHEATHMSTKINNAPRKENYGVLGQSDILGSAYGHYAHEVSGPTVRLLQRDVQFTDGTVGEVNTLEEFSAEYGALQYYKHLFNFGLKEAPIAANISPYNLIGYKFLNQALVDAQNYTGTPDSISWNQLWGGLFSNEEFFPYHQQTRRWDFLHDAGKAILVLNTNVSPAQFDEGNTAAVGLLAVADFVNFDATKRDILTTLITQLRSPAQLPDLADKLEIAQRKTVLAPKNPLNLKLFV